MIVEIVPYFLFALKLLTIFLSAVFIVSGLDEMFMDVVYMARLAYKQLFIYRKYQPLSEKQLMAVPEKPVAIMIPCWDESAVIRNMLDNTIRTLNYSNYWIFVGTYPNDPDTQREVELARETYHNIHRVVTPKDGPTNKADCLNWIYEGIKVFEKDNDIRFEIVVMNDSEDIVHPMYLRLLNYLIPRKDMVQVPVFPLPIPWWNLTRGHYVDEFAENHTRDMLVREILTGTVPSAGVGSGYSRKALELLAEDSDNQLFNIESLTEDYDFGLRMHKFKLKQVFVRQHVFLRATKKRLFGPGTETYMKKDRIGIREFFPGTFSTAVRQKSRWVMGIALQGWEKLGWTGGFWTRYMLSRDRKSIITNQINMMANMMVPIVLLLHLVVWMDPAGYDYPPLVEPGTLLWTMLEINLFFLCWRIMWRFIHVGRMYGPLHMLLSPIRMIWGNVINFFATMRALKLYFNYLRTGEVIKWDKTAHAYPTEAELRAYRRKLGDLLLERRFITMDQLDQALKTQKENGLPLGRILVDMGVVKVDDLMRVLGQQFSLKTNDIDPYTIPREVIALVPRETALRLNVFPLEITAGGALSLGVNAPLNPDDLADLEKITGKRVEQSLCTKSDLSFAIRRGYERLETVDDSTCCLGDRLVEMGACAQDRIDEALKKQRRSYARLGNILLRQGAINAKKLQEAEKAYFEHSTKVRFGDFLAEQGFVSRQSVDQALVTQANAVKPLGEILMEMGAVTQAQLNQALEKTE